MLSDAAARFAWGSGKPSLFTATGMVLCLWLSGCGAPLDDSPLPPLVVTVDELLKLAETKGVSYVSAGSEVIDRRKYRAFRSEGSRMLVAESGGKAAIVILRFGAKDKGGLPAFGGVLEASQGETPARFLMDSDHHEMSKVILGLTSGPTAANVGKVHVHVKVEQGTASASSYGNQRTVVATIRPNPDWNDNSPAPNAESPAQSR